jgi:hypothetical protein
MLYCHSMTVLAEVIPWSWIGIGSHVRTSWLTKSSRSNPVFRRRKRVKTGKMLLCVFFGLLVVLLLGACATTKYVPTPNKELYGTWISDQPMGVARQTQKIVTSSGGSEYYYKIADPTPMAESTAVVVSTWTDSEGSVWYKTQDSGTFGNFSGMKWQTLSRLSKSATVWEYEWTLVNEFDPNGFPDGIDAKDDTYSIYNRAGS